MLHLFLFLYKTEKDRKREREGWGTFMYRSHQYSCALSAQGPNNQNRNVCVYVYSIKVEEERLPLSDPQWDSAAIVSLLIGNVHGCLSLTYERANSAGLKVGGTTCPRLASEVHVLWYSICCFDSFIFKECLGLCAVIYGCHSSVQWDGRHVGEIRHKESRKKKKCNGLSHCWEGDRLIKQKSTSSLIP